MTFKSLVIYTKEKSFNFLVGVSAFSSCTLGFWLFGSRMCFHCMHLA